MTVIKKKLVKYLPLKLIRPNAKDNSLDYSKFMFSLNSYASDKDINDSNIKWSKPHDVGGQKFKTLIKNDKIYNNIFGDWKVSTNGRVYKDNKYILNSDYQNLRELIGSNINDKEYIKFNVGFYQDREEAMKHVKFRDDPYWAQGLIINKGQKLIPVFHRIFTLIVKKSILQKALGPIKQIPFIKGSSPSYDIFWDTIVENDKNQDIDGLRNSADSIRDSIFIRLYNFKDVNYDEVQPLNYHEGIAHLDCWMNVKNFIKPITNDRGICKFYSKEDTISTFPKNGCLYIELYYYYRDSIIKRYFSKNQQPKYDNWCISRIYKIIHGKDAIVPEYDNETAFGLTFNQLIKFAQYFQINLYLYDGFQGNLKCSYEYEKENPGRKRDTNFSNFHYVYANNHAWVVYKGSKRLLNLKTEVLENCQKINQELNFISDKLEFDTTINHEDNLVSFKFHKNNDTENLLFFNTIQEIVNFIETEIEEKNDTPYYIIYTNLDIKNVFCQLLLDYKIKCQQNFKYNSFDSLYIQDYLNKSILIKNLFTDSAGFTHIEDINQLISYQKLFHNLKNKLINPRYISFYSNQVLSIFTSFKKGPIKCGLSFEEDANLIDVGNNEYLLEDKFEIIGKSDFNKYFLSIFLKLQKLPVITFDDNFYDFDNHILEDYTMYYIKKIGNHFEYPFYQDDICFGMFLKQISPSNYSIIKYLRPSHLLDNPLMDDFKDLYNDDSISIAMKKDIGNIIFGFLHQKTKKSHISYFTTDKQEAKYFQQNIGGAIYPIEYNNNDIGHIFYKAFKSKLLNGFYPIGLLLYDGVHFYMDKLNKELKSVGFETLAFNVDCIYHNHDIQLYKTFQNKFPQYFNYDDVNSYQAIGGLKYETMEKNSYKEFTMKIFHLSFDLNSPNYISLLHENNYASNEYIDEIISHIHNFNRICFIGHGGYGKSTAILSACKKLNYKILILTKCHRLSDKWISEGYSSITVDHFFGLLPCHLMPLHSFSFQKYNQYDAFIFDDFFLYELKILNQIFILFQSKFFQNKKFFATADYLQINRIFDTDDFFFNNFEDNQFNRLLHIAESLFPNIIQLKVNKRLKSDQDKISYQSLISIMLDSQYNSYQKNLFINQWVQTHCNIITRSSIPLDIEYVITASNNDRNFFNNLIYRRKYKNQSKFSLHHIIMFDKGFNINDKNKFGKFQQFQIIKIENEIYTIQNILTKIIYPNLSKDYIINNFVYPFATTCHSWQGDTCHKKILIYGWNRNWLNLSWKFTALTRNIHFKDIYIIIDDSTDFNELKTDSYYQSCIDSYLKQDIQRFGSDKINLDRFIDIQWIKSQFHNIYMNKIICECFNVPNSVDRIDSNIPHYKNNCHVICFDCNRRKQSNW